MLAMIQVNLLPAEFRPGEKTNLSLIAVILVGLLVGGAAGLYGMEQRNKHDSLETQRADKESKKAELDRKVDHVKGLKKDISQQKDRQTTIIEISQSKIMWSLKLQQFGKIMQDFPGFWIRSLTLRPGSTKKTATLHMECSATGSSLREVARFRDAIKNSPNFFYHFSSLDSGEVLIRELEPDLNFTEKMDFSVNLPLRKPIVAKKKGAKK